MNATDMVAVDAARQPVVQIFEGEAMADSRHIAAYFGKQHYHVLRDIRHLHCSEDFRRSNFGLCEEIQQHSTGASKITYYRMTKDGFLFLVLGFGGDTAGKLKEAYICQFNAMQAELKRLASLSLPADIVEHIRRTDGISRMLSHKVTEIEKTNAAMLAALAAIAEAVRPPQPGVFRRGKTAGEILKISRYGGIKGLASWFGNRLEKFGCRTEDNACGELGLNKARLFDPDKAAFFLDNGGRVALEQKIAERRGQASLRLVGNAEGQQHA